MKHRRCQPSCLRVVTAAMVAIVKYPAAGQNMSRGMTELAGASFKPMCLEYGLMRDVAERQNHQVIG